MFVKICDLYNYKITDFPFEYVEAEMCTNDCMN